MDVTLSGKQAAEDERLPDFKRGRIDVPKIAELAAA